MSSETVSNSCSLFLAGGTFDGVWTWASTSQTLPFLGSGISCVVVGGGGYVAGGCRGDKSDVTVGWFGSGVGARIGDSSGISGVMGVPLVVVLKRLMDR